MHWDGWHEGIPHPKLSAHEIFKHAESYQRAAKRLADCEAEEALYFAYPAVNLLSIAVEIYLKCLVFAHKGSMVRGHDLDKLFRELPAPRRRDLQRLWEAYLPISPYEQMDQQDKDRIGWPPTLERALQLASVAQAHTRYAWERFEDSTFILADLPELLRRYIARSFPEWFPVRHTAQVLEVWRFAPTGVVREPPN